MGSVSTLLRKYLFIMGERWYKLALVVLCFLLNAALDVMGIGAFALLGRMLLEPETALEIRWLSWPREYFGWESPGQAVSFVGIAVLLLIMGRTALSYSINLWVWKFNVRKRIALQEFLHETYLYAPLSFRLKRNFSHMLYYSNHLPLQFVTSFSVSLMTLLSNLLLVSVISIFLAVTNFLATFAVAVLFGVAGSLYFFLIKDRVGRCGMESAQAGQDLLKNFRESLGGLNEVRILGCEPFFMKRTRNILSRIFNADYHLAALNQLPRPMAELFLVGFIVVLMLAYYTVKGEITGISVTLGMFGLAGLRMVPALSIISACLNGLKSGSIFVHRLYDELEEVREVRLHDEALTGFAASALHAEDSAVMEFRDKVELRNLSFHYDENLGPVLDRVDLSIPKGRRIAIVGRSGSGKSTLINILLGQLVPQSGTVTVDGRSIFENLRAWQNRICYLPQSIYVLDDSVVRNVAFGIADEDVDRDRVRWALEQAQLWEMVTNLPQQMDTPLGDQGDRISGGQRQRIGIARALYHHRDILIMDEATSALDEETERQVKDALQRLPRDITIIMITHNLREETLFDEILTIEGGRIAGSRPGASTPMVAGESGQAV